MSVSLCLSVSFSISNFVVIFSLFGVIKVFPTCFQRVARHRLPCCVCLCMCVRYKVCSKFYYYIIVSIIRQLMTVEGSKGEREEQEEERGKF